MNKLSVVIFIYLSFFVIHCREKRLSNKLSKDGSVRIEGNFIDDSVYDGKMKFYDVSTSKLIEESYYSFGKQEGKYKKYYGNGKLALEADYINNTRNGFIFVYDKNGTIQKKQFMYYGLRVGPSIDCSANAIKNFSFTSFDNEILFELNYDSIGGKKITDMLTDFFFFYYRNSIQIIGNETKTKREYFLYTPNPPKYNFEYSLVSLKNSYEVINIIESFDKEKSWSTFTVPNTDSIYAVRLIISDSIANDRVTMLKKLE